MTRARASLVCGFALSVVLLGAPAVAQTPPPGQMQPCSPPCGPTETCFQGQCMVPAPPSGDAPAVPPPAVAPALPPPTSTPPPPEVGTVEPAPPPPARRKRPRAEAHKVVEEEEIETEQTTWRRGVLVLPFAGFQTVQGPAGEDYDAGARFGMLMGVHAAPVASLNVELAMDILNPKMGAGAPRGTDISGRDFTIAFAPLFHASNGIGEFVVGPKLGYWSSSLESKVPGFGTTQGSQTGWAFGFNLGAFAGVTDAAALGVLASYQMTSLSQTCTRDDTSEDCGLTVSAPQILSFNLAALF